LIAELIKLDRGWRLGFFEDHAHLIEGDSCYWNVLATIWMDAPNTTLEISRWRKLFSSSRRNRHKMMKKSDRRAWRNLPEKVKCFRAINPGEDVNKAISWTLSKETALFFQRRNGGKIIEQIFPKQSVIAYFDRRGEQEIIVLRGDSNDK